MRKLLLLVAALAVAGPVGAYLYFNVIQDDAPSKLSLSGSPGTTAAPGGAVASGDLSGTWKPTARSQVGYRVNEVAFGQRKAAVGRTNKVTGTMTVSGTTVSAADLVVDMASMTSDEPRRDSQFRGRIMSVSQFPTARFRLTSPVTFPAGARSAKATAQGELTLRGTTKPVTVELSAQQVGSEIEVNGSIPISFDEWGIPNPSFGPISTEDHGELELLVVFAKA